MSNVNERYSAMPIAANGNFGVVSANQVGGFACVTSGTLTLTNGKGLVIISGFPVTAGVYHPLPFYTSDGFVVQLAGGASGTLAYI